MRDQTGLTLVEGQREIRQVLKAHVPVEKIFVCPELCDQGFYRELLSWKKGGPIVLEVSKQLFSKISFGERQEGLLAVVKPQRISLRDISFKNIPLLVMVEGVEKPGNLGAILRTADAAGIDALLVCAGRTDVYNPNVIRASLGAVFTVPVVEGDGEAILKFLKEKKITICTTLPLAKKVYTQVDLKIPLAIVLGSEQNGLNRFWIDHADTQVKIPMHGQVDSLNVSTSAAIMIYETLRQRKKI